MLTIVLIGGVIASFLYAATSTTSIKFMYRRSQCDRCNGNLRWHHLIPVASFILLKGKCKFCREKIDLSYPLCEIIVIILFVLPLFFGLGLVDYILYFLFVVLLVLVSFYDFILLIILTYMCFLFLFFGLGLVDYTLYYLIVALLVPVSFYDFNTLTIPNHMSLLFLITGLYLTELYYIEPIRDFSIILLLHLVYFLFSESIGYGDIK